MTQEDKKLLLQDLCARLQYNVILHIKYYDLQGSGELDERDIELTYENICYCIQRSHWVDFKPYLRPMSSMTEEEKKELLQISNFDSDVDDICYDYICCIERTSIDIIDIANFISWLNAHHFDYRGLIERGLAIVVNENNNPYK